MTYKFQGYEIPNHVLGGLERYINDHIRPGDFLMAVLCNDFVHAVAKADTHSIQNLKAYMGYLYNVAPSVCWGSHENVRDWLNTKL